MSPATPAPAARPAWTTGWLWAGLAAFFGGLLIASRAVGGYGDSSGCGMLGLHCLGQAFGWLVATQGLAAALLWMAVARLPPRGWLKGLCTSVAAMSSLLFAVGGGFVLLVLFKPG